jgi:hypothetical protein
MPFVLLWCKAFALTLALELPIAVLLLRGRSGGAPVGRRVAAVLVANLASHPAVWFVFPELGTNSAAVLVASELWAFASEAAIYRLIFAGPPPLAWRRAVLVSAVANALSFLVGKALTPLLFR